MYRIDEQFKETYKLLRKDLEIKSGVAECRVVLTDDDLRKMHDRYIFDDEKIWGRSVELINNWEKILQKKEQMKSNH